MIIRKQGQVPDILRKQSLMNSESAWSKFGLQGLKLFVTFHLTANAIYRQVSQQTEKFS